MGVNVHISNGTYQTVLGLIGDTSSIDTKLIDSLKIVDSVKRVSEILKRRNRSISQSTPKR